MNCIESYIPKFLDMLYDGEIAKHLTIEEVRDAFHTNQIESKNKQV